MAFAIFDPLGNPVGFISFFFLQNALVDPLAPLKLALYSSILVFPFVLAGRFVYSRLLASKSSLAGMKTARFWKLLASCFTASVTFWVVLSLWVYAFHREFPAVGATGVLYGILLGTAVSTLLAWLGMKLLAAMRSHWQMPTALSVYIAELLMNAVFWAGVTLYFSWTMNSFVFP
ncbi:hypothetical protein HYS54_00685 [Candidatus Micrarchaeota archaeon]|nr:hypothetical protein [Candidatus Micrarchaeota archaeon]